MEVIINNNNYEVVIIKKNNKNTYMRVKEDLKIYVTTNKFSNNNDIKNLIKENEKKLIDMINMATSKNNYNQSFYYLGKLYDIKLSGNINLDKWYREKASLIFNERLKINYDKFSESIPFPELKIKKLKAKWGMCSKHHQTITLSLELIKRSYEEIDYVIIHELTHLIHFNHSQKFWKAVEKYCPNWKIMRKTLAKF